MLKSLHLKGGGGSWIRTSVGVSQQIYSLPPLATRASLLRDLDCSRFFYRKNIFRYFLEFVWRGWRGSNPRPLASEANTLSTELQPLTTPATRELTKICSPHSNPHFCTASGNHAISFCKSNPNPFKYRATASIPSASRSKDCPSCSNQKCSTPSKIACNPRAAF